MICQCQFCICNITNRCTQTYLCVKLYVYTRWSKICQLTYLLDKPTFLPNKQIFVAHFHYLHIIPISVQNLFCYCMPVGIVCEYAPFSGKCGHVGASVYRENKDKEILEQVVCQQQSGYIQEFCRHELSILFPCH